MGIRVIGASFDTVEDNRAFAENEHFGFPLVCDVERQVGPLYGAARPPDDPYPAYARRITYLIDPAGVIRKAYVVTDIPSHPGEVVAELERLAQESAGL